MKILIVTARYYPENFSITNIAEFFAANGHDTTVLTGIPNYGENKVYDNFDGNLCGNHKGVKIIRIKEHIRKKGLISLILNYFSFYRKMPAKLKKLSANKYDIVLSYGISPIITMRGIKKFCNKQNIKHIHYGVDIWPESFLATNFIKKKNFLFRLLKKYSAKLYSSCDLITFASPCVEKYMSNFLGVNRPFKHIYQPTLTDKPDLNLVKGHEYCANGKINILYCGSIARFHRLDLFLKALSKCHNKDKFNLHIVGSGSELENIKKTANELKMRNVFFYGRVSSLETINFYLKSDVLYVPLFINSFTSNMIPQKLIEYLMYNRPIFGMIGGDGKDILKNASNSNIISGQTISELTKNLDALSNKNVDELKRCGDENRLYFDNNSRFTLKTICSELIECMENINDYENISNRF